MRKAFDIEMDLEEFAKKIDVLQRKKLSNEETESIFIAKTELLYLLNMLRENDMNKIALENALYELKEEFNKNRLYIDSETFDIFGNVDDDNRKIKYIGSSSHRENEKSKYKILNIHKKIDVFDFTEKLQGTLNYLEGAIPKITAEYDMSLYKVVQITEKVNENQESTSMFVEVKQAMNWKIVYHKDTKVMYAVSDGSYSHGIFTLLVNEDGTPMLYKGGD
jgi:hypothetical protein